MASNLPASAFAVQSPQSPINYYGIEGREIYRTTFMARYTALENRVFRFDINSTVQEMENDWAALLNAAYNVLGKVVSHFQRIYKRNISCSLWNRRFATLATKPMSRRILELTVKGFS